MNRSWRPKVVAMIYARDFPEGEREYETGAGEIRLVWPEPSGLNA
jgi:hypothetical protein